MASWLSRNSSRERTHEGVPLSQNKAVLDGCCGGPSPHTTKRGRPDAEAAPRAAVWAGRRRLYWSAIVACALAFLCGVLRLTPKIFSATSTSKPCDAAAPPLPARAAATTSFRTASATPGPPAVPSVAGCLLGPRFRAGSRPRLPSFHADAWALKCHLSGAASLRWMEGAIAASATLSSKIATAAARPRSNFASGVAARSINCKKEVST